MKIHEIVILVIMSSPIMALNYKTPYKGLSASSLDWNTSVTVGLSGSVGANLI